MKYGILVYDNYPECGGKNIGDYIQSLAAGQFIPNNCSPVLLYRDHLNDYNGEPVKVIMNGWYTHIPENFPPSENIIPLFVAVHINSTVKDKFLTPKIIQYLKKYEPIGCRDMYTERLLKSYGIDSYFSGCMTLTLGRKYKSTVRSDEVIFVDPYISFRKTFSNVASVLRSIVIRHGVIRGIERKMFIQCGIKNFLKTAFFYAQYSRLWNDSFLLSATYINHMFELKSEEDYLSKAEELIRIYAKAKLVITSRIHVALPCTGLETPVIFINNSKDSDFSTCRFEGLIELFNVINHDGKNLVFANDFLLENPPIKLNYKKYADNLIRRCEEFVLA